jgi:hypothetical protein
LFSVSADTKCNEIGLTAARAQAEAAAAKAEAQAVGAKLRAVEKENLALKKKIARINEDRGEASDDDSYVPESEEEWGGPDLQAVGRSQRRQTAAHPAGPPSAGAGAAASSGGEQSNNMRKRPHLEDFVMVDKNGGTKRCIKDVPVTTLEDIKQHFRARGVSSVCRPMNTC